MDRAYSRVLLVAGVGSLLAATLPAQTVDQVIGNYYQAAGGLDAMKAIHAWRVSGVTSSPNGEAPFTRITLRPGLARVDFKIGGVTATQAYDGKTAWWFMPFMGQTAPDTMPTALAANMKEEAAFDGPLVDYALRGIQVELVGKEQVDSTSAYKLRVTMPSGNVTYYYIDAATSLPIRTEMTRTVQGQQVTVVTTMKDYRREGGVMIPHAFDVTQGQGSQSFTIDKVEMNPPLTPADFRMPPKPGGGG